jgi:hypothetical protein
VVADADPDLVRPVSALQGIHVGAEVRRIVVERVDDVVARAADHQVGALAARQGVVVVAAVDQVVAGRAAQGVVSGQSEDGVVLRRARPEVVAGRPGQRRHLPPFWPRGCGAGRRSGRATLERAECGDYGAANRRRTVLFQQLSLRAGVVRGVHELSGSVGRCRSETAPAIV